MYATFKKSLKIPKV